MMRVGSRLIFAIIALIIIVLLGLGVLLGQLLKENELQSFDDRLKKECVLVSTEIANGGGLQKIDYSQLNRVVQKLDVQTVVMDNNGTILFNSTKSNNLDIIITTNIIQADSKGPGMVQPGPNDVWHYYYSPMMVSGKKTGYLVMIGNTSSLDNNLDQIWWILSLSLGFVSFLIILLGIRITTKYTKPLESAINVAMELSKGNYRARASIGRMDEIGKLNSSINILARNLQEMVKANEMQQDRLSVLIENIGAGLILIDSRGYINLINKGYKEIFQVEPEDYLNQLYYEVIEQKEVSKLVEDIFITEQKVSKQMLLTLSIERRYFDVYGVPIIGTNNVWKGVLLVFHDITDIKNLEQMRKDFVANVSHELKTPVTSIKGFSETLLDGAMNDKKALEEFLSIILKESERLQSLINDLLELSKIEQQNFKLNIQEFDIRQTLQEIMKILSYKAEEKSIRLNLNCPSESIILKGDMHRLKQVFINLIGNAISYTPQNGCITITVREQEQYVRISVKDTGIGIEKKEISRIFERFYRVDRARSRNSGGTGLGLAIVKHIVEAHRGKISVNSELSKGSEFIIELKKEL